MRKINFVLSIAVIITVAFISCSEDDDFTKTSFINVKMDYDSGDEGPSGYVCLFDITENKVKNHDVSFFTHDTGEKVAFMRDVNNEMVLPVYWPKKFTPSKDTDSGYYINRSIFSIFWNELPSYYEQKDSNKFLLYIRLESTKESNYSPQYTSKVINWNNDIDLKYSKTFIKSHQGFSEW